MESAARHAKSLQGGASPTQSDATNRLGQGFTKECYRCGQSSTDQHNAPIEVPNATAVVNKDTWRTCARLSKQWLRRNPLLLILALKLWTMFQWIQWFSKPFAVDVMLNGKPLTMELDTGATVSIISNETCWQLLPNVNLQPCNVKLHSYSGVAIIVLGNRKQMLIMAINMPSFH